MDIEQLESWLIMTHLPGVGLKSMHKLLAVYQSPANLISSSCSHSLLNDAAVDYIKMYQRRRSKHPILAYTEQVMTWLENPKHTIITLLDDDYPESLRQITDAPMILYLNGQRELLRTMQIAIIGSRQATRNALSQAHKMAEQLVDLNITITGGLALGVDSAGHQGALNAGGNTIAVLGTGIDRVYPKQHAALAEQIAEQGLIVSEFPLKSPPLKRHFPLRNRIISGLSLGVLVVEATLRSGSLITARLALEQGRDVFAMPSSVANVKARGCHWLIKQGAKLVECVADITDELNLVSESTKHDRQSEHIVSDSAQLSHLQHQVLACIGYEETHLDEVIEQLTQPISDILATLTELELLELIYEEAGGYVRRL